MEEIRKERDAEAKLEAEKEHREFEKLKAQMVVAKAMGLLVAASAILAGLYLTISQGNRYGVLAGVFLMIVGITIAGIVLDAGSSERRPKLIWAK